MLVCAIVRFMLSTTCETQRRNDSLVSHLIKYSRLDSTFPKAMNKTKPNNERVFIFLGGRTGSGKSQLILIG